MLLLHFLFFLDVFLSYVSKSSVLFFYKFTLYLARILPLGHRTRSRWRCSRCNFRRSSPSLRRRLQILLLRRRCRGLHRILYFLFYF